jgi:hypothetical protein
MDMNPIMVVYVVGSALMSILAVPLILRRVPPSPLYGFRVPATLRDPRLWYEANRYAGWRLLVVGILAAGVAVGLPQIPGIRIDGYALACLGVVGGGLAVTVGQSFVYLASLQPGERDSDTHE